MVLIFYSVFENRNEICNGFQPISLICLLATEYSSVGGSEGVQSRRNICDGGIISTLGALSWTIMAIRQPSHELLAADEYSNEVFM